MNCALARLILESIRTWIASNQSLRTLAQIELRWIEVGIQVAWPAFEEFLAILFFERQRDIGIMQPVTSNRVTADEMILLQSMTVSRWDPKAATRYLQCFLSEASAAAAAVAATRVLSERRELLTAVDLGSADMMIES